VDEVKCVRGDPTALRREKAHRISVKEKLPTSELPGVVLVGSFFLVRGVGAAVMPRLSGMR
jgi:hypothetical protein